jgi:hypothetical protein
MVDLLLIIPQDIEVIFRNPGIPDVLMQQATIIDEILETLARETLVRNGGWIICLVR